MVLVFLLENRSIRNYLTQLSAREQSFSLWSMVEFMHQQRRIQFESMREVELGEPGLASRVARFLCKGRLIIVIKKSSLKTVLHDVKAHCPVLFIACTIIHLKTQKAE